MVQFECSFEVATRDDAVFVLQEMIDHINDGYWAGYFGFANGSWSSNGIEEDDEEDDEDFC